MWITPAAMHHIFRYKDVSSNRKIMTLMITLFFLIIFHSHRCFQPYIYFLQDFLRHVINTATIRVLQKFHYNYHGDCRILANGTCKYAIWNATIASLQFWAEDLDPITLGIVSECIYTTYFWTPTSHTLHQLSEDVLFGCFVIALNAAFTQQLSLADEGYESEF